MANDYDKLSREELVEIVHAYSLRTKFGLVWEDTPEEIVEFSKKNLPYPVRDAKKSFSRKHRPERNILLEGDNYQSLLALTATHAGKIDCIYIDPPYNTGAKDWIYNNDYVDSNDTYRHSKWLSMMKNRLQLAKVLLKEDGVLICAIDENEFTRLGLLIEKIFSSHENHCITIVHNPRGVQGRNFSYTHEYAYFSFERGQKVIGDRRIPVDEVKWSNFRNWGGESERSDAKNCFYPVIIEGEEIVGFGDVSLDSEHPDQNVKNREQIYIYPIDKNGIERKWRYARQSVEEIRQHLRVKKTNDGIEIEIGRPFETVRTMWRDPRYDANMWGTKLVEALVPNNGFDFPKSVWTTYDCIAPVIRDRKDAIVLDFFAGSGTTGHAVQILNSEDGGTRRFILCTNNENGIAENVTYKRLKAICKKTSGYEEITGLDFSLDYLKVNVMPKSENIDEKLIDFMDVIIPFVNLIEETYEVIVETDLFQISKSQNKCVGIYHSLDSSGLDDFKTNLLKEDGVLTAYVASLDHQGLQNFDLYGWESIVVKTLPIEVVLRMEANCGN